jgi:E3 ubiquitin-protein ligase HUWE1
MAVTDGNKHEYVRLMAHHRLTASFRAQLDALLSGFHAIIPRSFLSHFDAKELELLICGLPDIDFDDLRAHTTYSGYTATSDVIRSFWTVLNALDLQEKALFLQFVTGTSKVPLGGFKSLQGMEGTQHFSVHKAYNTALLPTAHTCFNQLDLPNYDSTDELREKLLIAIKEGSEGFGFA